MSESVDLVVDGSEEFSEGFDGWLMGEVQTVMRNRSFGDSSRQLECQFFRFQAVHFFHLLSGGPDRSCRI